MNFKVRRALPCDLEDMIVAERAAMNSDGYLSDTAEEFYLDRIGRLLVAETDDGKVVAVAKYTVVYDGSAWLETLRVHPDYQRRGIGRMFYDEFVKLSHELGVDYMRMYTGAKNIPSASLARLYGLETEQIYSEMSLDIPTSGEPDGEPEFVRVSPERAVELLETARESARGFLVLNRTFYHIAPPLCEGLAKEGKVYEHAASGSFIVLGNRFLPRRSLQIGLMSGDLSLCLAFAKAEGIRSGTGKLITMFPPENASLREFLTAEGFVPLPSDLMVMGGRV